VALTTRGQGTSVYDALLLSLVTAPLAERRQLTVVMTDADDTTSVFDDRIVLETARHAYGQMSFVVVRGGGARADGSVLDAFRAIARSTGGEFLQIDADEQLSAAFLTAVDNFRNSYVLRYSPTGVPGSGWHEVGVTVKGRRYTVRARRGYTAK
jgi:hypothetical protein